MDKTIKTILTFFILFACFSFNAEAKKRPQIHFEKTVVDFGKFSSEEPIQKAKFKFTNTGQGNLVINYVHTSCGCTVADFTKDVIRPGASGYIYVTYDGKGKYPGKFKKHIQVFTNCSDEVTVLYIQGDMTALVKENK